MWSTSNIIEKYSRSFIYTVWIVNYQRFRRYFTYIWTQRRWMTSKQLLISWIIIMNNSTLRQKSLKSITIPTLSSPIRCMRSARKSEDTLPGFETLRSSSKEDQRVWIPPGLAPGAQMIKENRAHHKMVMFVLTTQYIGREYKTALANIAKPTKPQTEEHALRSSTHSTLELIKKKSKCYEKQEQL